LENEKSEKEKIRKSLLKAKQDVREGEANYKELMSVKDDLEARHRSSLYVSELVNAREMERVSKHFWNYGSMS